jgi:hypothetical protein
MIEPGIALPGPIFLHILTMQEQRGFLGFTLVLVVVGSGRSQAGMQTKVCCPPVKGLFRSRACKRQNNDLRALAVCRHPGGLGALPYM